MWLTLFSHPPITPCHHCGSTVYNEKGKQVVVRNGKKKAVVRFDQFNHLPLIMNVAKQRYTCKNCAHHWTATPYFVERGHSISRVMTMGVEARCSKKGVALATP